MISTTLWVDLEDGHEYHEGDKFPHDGRKIASKRIEELSGTANNVGFPVIVAEDEENPIHEDEQPKTAEKQPKK